MQFLSLVFYSLGWCWEPGHSTKLPNSNSTEAHRGPGEKREKNQRRIRKGRKNVYIHIYLHIDYIYLHIDYLYLHSHNWHNSQAFGFGVSLYFCVCCNLLRHVWWTTQEDFIFYYFNCVVCYAKVPQLFFGIHSTSLACQNYIKRRYNTCNLFSGTEQHWCFFLFCLRHASFCSTCSGFADSGVITVCLGLFLLFSVSCCFWPRWCIRLRQVSRFWLPIFVSFLTCPSDDVWIRAYITHTLDIFCFCLCLARDWRKILANTSIAQKPDLCWLVLFRFKATTKAKTE